MFTSLIWSYLGILSLGLLMAFQYLGSNLHLPYMLINETWQSVPPWWMVVFPGLGGVLMTIMALEASSVIGVGTFMMLSIASRLITSLILDLTTLFRDEPRTPCWFLGLGTFTSLLGISINLYTEERKRTALLSKRMEEVTYETQSYQTESPAERELLSFFK